MITKHNPNSINNTVIAAIRPPITAGKEPVFSSVPDVTVLTVLVVDTSTDDELVEMVLAILVVMRDGKTSVEA